MPWPQTVLNEFSAIPEGDDVAEKHFHGPYNKLLHTLFPADSKYTIVPQSMPTWREGGDFIFTFHITVRKVPVFVLELKAPADLKIQSERDLADDHIRRQPI